MHKRRRTLSALKKPATHCHGPPSSKSAGPCVSDGLPFSPRLLSVRTHSHIRSHWTLTQVCSCYGSPAGEQISINTAKKTKRLWTPRHNPKHMQATGAVPDLCHRDICLCASAFAYICCLTSPTVPEEHFPTKSMWKCVWRKMIAT